MLTICHFYKSLLSKDIEININSKIENIKNANNWFNFNVKSACEKIDFTTLGINDIKYHASLLENISKLSVDLLLDYDYYKNFIFKGQFRSVDYDDKLRMLGYEIEDDYWHNVKKPSKDTVTMNVFLNCLYKSLIEIMNDDKTKYNGDDNFEKDLVEDQDIKGENKLIIEIKTSTENCVKIDTNIGVVNERECETNKLECRESFSVLEEENFIEDKSQICTGKFDNAHLIEEINIIGEIDKINSNNCDKLEPKKRPQIDNVPNEIPNKINIKGENEKLDSTNTNKLKQNMETQSGKDEPTHKNMQTYRDILNKNPNQWICKTCECLSPFNLVNCQACGAHCNNNGYWSCCYCSCVNEMINNICSACNTNNELIVPANKWKCWKPVCNELNDDKIKFCHKCGLQRTRPIVFSDLVERKVKDKIVKLWICEKCWQYNNDNFKYCSKKNCGEPRIKETGKITDKTNMKTGDSDLNHNKDRTGNSDLNHNKDRTGNSDLNHNKDRTGNSDLNRNKERIIPGNQEIIRDNRSNNLKENGKGEVETTQENHSNIDRNVVETEWKCWNKKCERMNKTKHNYCQTCKLDRNPPDPETQLVKCYTGNIIKEIWICRKCEKYNLKDQAKCEGKNCGSYKYYTTNHWKDDKNNAENPNIIKTNPSQWECDKCTFVNNGKEKYCTVCFSERNNYIGQTSTSWKCWFANCRQTNDNQYEFCQHCKLFRFSKTGRGELVKCQDKNGIKDVWICQKCFKYNNFSNQICSGKYCENSRF